MDGGDARLEEHTFRRQGRMPGLRRYAARKALVPISYMLAPLERTIGRLMADEGLGRWPPVFILGPPRCGSTLLFKVLTDRYWFAYPTRFSAYFYRTPAIGFLLSELLRIRPTPGYAISYGNMPGLGAPHEAGDLWYRWFPRGMHVYVGPGATSTRVLASLRRQVGAIAAVSRRPAIFKNLFNSMRIAPLVEALPEALFVVCRRTPSAIAASILRGRLTQGSGRDKWWSLPPKEIDALLTLPFYEQIARQILDTYEQIESDKKRFGPSRFIDIWYEDLCVDAHGALRRLEAFFRERGCVLEERADVPATFSMREPQPPSDPSFVELERAVGRLFGE